MSGLYQRKRRLGCKVTIFFETLVTGYKDNNGCEQKMGTLKLNMR